MPTIPTTAGALDTDQLGFVLTHEHVMICSPEVRQVWPASFDAGVARTRCVARLRAAKAAGVDTLIDVTTIDFGRDAAFIEEVARAAELRVAVSTGVWNVPIYFQYQPLEAAEAFFVKEIPEGIEGSAAHGCADQDHDQRTDADAGRRQGLSRRRSRTPTHRACRSPRTPRLRSEAAWTSNASWPTKASTCRGSLSATARRRTSTICHQLLDRGSFVSIDRFGSDNESAARRGRPTHAQRLEIVSRLCREGYAGQVLLSHDTSGISVFPVDWFDQTYPNGRFDYIPRDVLPELLEAGLSQAQIDQMTRDNPRQLFSRQTTVLTLGVRSSRRP